jgi:nucleoside 2-deoxyribosyltransferase
VQTIFENNRDAIRTSDLVVANLNGITTDDGTAWELGYAAALQKYSIGIFTDWRTRFEGEEVVNLMISRSLNTIVQSLDELVSVLSEYQEKSN